MSIQMISGLIAAAISIIAMVPYFWDIYKGNTKPSPITYGIFVGSGAVRTFTYIAVGATATAIYPAVLLITAIAILILALHPKYGYRQPITIVDKLCVVLAVLSLAAAIFIGSEIGLYTAMLTMIVGFIPTIKKSYVHPSSENLTSWNMALVAAIFNLFALTSLQIDILVLPVISFLCVFLTVGAIYLGRVREKSDLALAYSTSQS